LTDLTAKYAVLGRLEDDDIITDCLPFLDTCGDDPTRIYPGFGNHDNNALSSLAVETISVDLQMDENLRKLLEESAALLAAMATNDEVVPHEVLEQFVVNALGTDHVTLEQFHDHVISLIGRYGYRIPLGAFRIGMQRHRALLFKVNLLFFLFIFYLFFLFILF